MPKNFQQNGMAERCNHTLMDMMRSMIDNFSLSLNLWREVLKIAMYILNWVPTKVVPKTPSELRMGRKLNLAHLYVWGCPIEA